MGSKDRAQVEAELTGAPKIEADAKKINRALGDVKKTAGEGVTAGVNKATASLQVMGAKADAVRSALSPTNIAGGLIGGMVLSSISSVTEYLGKAADAARAFGEKSSGIGRRAGMEYGQLGKMTAESARNSLQGADAQLDFVDAVNQLNYGGKGAAESLKTVDDVATALGRSDKDLAPLVASLQSIDGLAGDVTRELRGMVEQADRLHVIGGPQALVDGIAGLRPVLENIGPGAVAAKKKLEALQVLAQRTMTPGQANGFVSNVVGWVEGNAGAIARTPGVKLNIADIMDPKTGHARDPVATWEYMQNWSKKIGHGSPSKRQQLISDNLGGAQGVQVLMGPVDATEVPKEVKRKAERDAAAAASLAERNARILETDEGQRAAREEREKDRERRRGGTWQALRDAAGNAWDAAQFTDEVRSGAPNPNQQYGDLAAALQQNAEETKANTAAMKGQTLSPNPTPPGVIR